MERHRSGEVLAVWASVGLVFLLCGPWVLTNDKLYHQLIIFLLWLPALLALLRDDLRQGLKKPEWLLFAAFMLWTWVVIAVEGGDDAVGKIKVTLYVALTLAGTLLAARNQRWQIETLLLCSSVFGGLLAAVSWAWFLTGAPQTMGYRVVALGLWDTIIMAAHAVGALAVLGVYLLKIRWLSWRGASWLLLPVLGYALFLGFSQTRGVWTALLASLLVMAVARPSKAGTSLIILVVICTVGVLVFSPDTLLQRGFSYRDTLWNGGIGLLRQHWETGMGFHEYSILVPETGQSFKHPHNLFIDTGVRLGMPGLLLFGALWLTVGWRGWRSRAQPLGRALLALWVFSSVSLMTDGIGLWLKPNADWLITWLPIGLSLVLSCRESIGTSPKSTLTHLPCITEEAASSRESDRL